MTIILCMCGRKGGWTTLCKPARSLEGSNKPHPDEDQLSTFAEAVMRLSFQLLNTEHKCAEGPEAQNLATGAFYLFSNQSQLTVFYTRKKCGSLNANTRPAARRAPIYWYETNALRFILWQVPAYDMGLTSSSRIFIFYTDERTRSVWSPHQSQRRLSKERCHRVRISIP